MGQPEEVAGDTMSMSVVVQHAPRFSNEQAAALASSLFAVDGTIEPLPSERDQNFLVTDDTGARYVLKIANATEPIEMLEFQNRAIEHLAARTGHLALPRILRTRDGAAIAEADGPDGRRHFVRLLTYIPGVIFAHVRPHSEVLLESLGRRVAEMDLAFDGFSHPAMHRPFRWDLKQASWLQREITRIEDTDRRAAVTRCLERFESEVAPALSRCRAQVIHNDWNDYNVLVAPEDTETREVVGALDFGDMVHSVLVGDLAVAIAYAVLDKPDPIAAAVPVVRGYHARLPLKEDEIALLYDLICLRLCLSIGMAACQTALAPANEYLQISQQQVWRTLVRLQTVPPAYAHYRFRHACGLTPCPQSEGIRRWLARQQGSCAPVLGPALASAKHSVLDLSVGSLDIPNPTAVADLQAFSALVTSLLAQAGAKVGIGRYDEPRLVYASSRFTRLGNDGDEARTVHLGIDLFVPAGTPVCAPLDGTVHSVRNNAAPLDYGPTVVIEHRTDEGTPFYTLYGHLSAQSLEGVERGASLARGERFAHVGDPTVNGGWPPHLHIQIIADLLGYEGDFPGVAAPSDREVWLSLSPDPSLLLGLPEAGTRASQTDSHKLLRRRHARLGPNLSVSYRRPLTIVRGFMQHLYDAHGVQYLDAVNNVPHVGHSHPRVVGAAARQMAVLNTNTRYLHELLVTYAERLTALLPDPLRVCYIVCSGSEANELALRLARAHTGRRDVVVIEGGYHGNTSSLIDISSYKFDGPGGRGAPPHVHKVPMPDDYRGLYRRGDPDLGVRYARHVDEICSRLASEGRGPAAFVAESILSCGGQIVLPDGYLEAAYRAVRQAGGVCIADEVQVGFGRVGTSVWAFETQHVVPDIVTLGKPIGNGFPLAAVVTTPEIAASFDNGMEYFNTYGGNPVACAVGLAVLDVMRDEQLQPHALAVGARLRAELAALMSRYLLVGDVRGLGLFLGVELVRNRETREPAPGQAAYVINRMRDRGVLVSTDGPCHNVIKIKPPLPFTDADADRLVDTLAAVLSEDPAQPDAAA